MALQDLARKRGVQALVIFGVAVTAGYYFWLKKKKDNLKWAQATGTNKLLTEPKEVTSCKKACTGSSDWNQCMAQCLQQQVGTL